MCEWVGRKSPCVSGWGGRVHVSGWGGRVHKVLLMTHSVACSVLGVDIRERFHYVVLMLVVLMRNFSQSGDTSEFGFNLLTQGLKHLIIIFTLVFILPCVCVFMVKGQQTFFFFFFFFFFFLSFFPRPFLKRQIERGGGGEVL